jgi:glucose-1-phosphate cytidylyltransferase
VKAVILAGGLGSRLSEETVVRPKPMVEIGGKPILWHILNIYAAGGVTEFVVACGYRGEDIKEYFLNFYALNNSITVDLSHGGSLVHHGKTPQWKLHLIDTGLHTQTGGRLKRAGRVAGCRRHLPGDLRRRTCRHRCARAHRVPQISRETRHRHRRASRGALGPDRDGRQSSRSIHREAADRRGLDQRRLLRAGRRALDYIDGDETLWEREPMERLARDGELMAYRHEGFWQPMDTLREKRLLEDLWTTGKAPWKVWP